MFAVREKTTDQSADHGFDVHTAPNTNIVPEPVRSAKVDRAMRAPRRRERVQRAQRIQLHP